jgi:DNA invertase Pin-like site-specific DNA recombinase
MSTRPSLRCAIYTRVSTEHGLEQEFNSLDNQREAAEAYIKSQAHEGWRCLPAKYDDGGFSGGSMERPALQALLTEIQARRVDVVVVYKVDRLTRSLADFAKLVELFDRYGVSFVSVTQAFNTTTSMGRLTLNVLLSFAQFEREVTGERIRDKIRASKQKGIWMGGVVPLAYRVENRALHVVEEHAAVIRSIFARYLDLGTVAALKRSLDESGIVVPERTDGAGRLTGGGPFSRGHLYKVLKSPIYVGRLSHKGRVHEGQHPAILDLATWEAVQLKLAHNTRGHTRQRLESTHLLVGRIRTPDGSPITPTHAQKGPRRYRYYIARSSPVLRLQAAAIEAAVVGALRSAIANAPASDAELVGTHLRQVIVHPDRLELQLTGERDCIDAPWSPEPTRRGRDIIVPAQEQRQAVRPMKAEDRARILKAIATGRTWMDDLVTASVPGTDAIASRERLSSAGSHEPDTPT